MQITIDKALSLRAGLTALDGYNKIIKNGENESTAVVPFKLSGVMRMTIARNISRLEQPLADYNKARNEVIKSLAGPDGNAVPPEKLAEFLAQDVGMRKQETELSLTKLKVADLNLDDNPIPGSVLAMLLDLVGE